MNVLDSNNVLSPFIFVFSSTWSEVSLAMSKDEDEIFEACSVLLF